MWVLQVFNVYCQRKGLERDELKFMFEGSLLANGDATPEEVCAALNGSTCLPLHWLHAKAFSS